METKRYRVCLVVWRDKNNTDTEYLKDFEYQLSAIDWASNTHIRQNLLQKSLWYDNVAIRVDIDVEEWGSDDNIKVIWTSKLWEN